MTGKVLNGRYEVHQQVGAGGMAIIYAAVDLATGWDVAVKVLRREFSNDSEFVRRFKREAQAVANLDHPNIVRVYDVGQDEGVHYIVMEYVENITLKEYIRKNGTLTVENAMRICLDICGALKNAHDNGVIHRDVKPHNVLVSPDGGVKITDFGIAKFADTTTSSTTEGGNVMGSVHYISPEQARGEETDEQADIYSLGVTLYEMLTGRLPYEGESTIEVARKHINEPLTPPEQTNPKIPHSLSQVVVKAMAKDVAVRYSSCGEFARDLMRSYSDPNGNFVDIPAVRQRPRAPKQAQQLRERDYDYEQEAPYPKPRPKSHKSVIIILLSILIILLGAALTVFLISRSNTRNEAEVVTVEVPQLVGTTSTAAQDALNAKGLIPDVASEYHDEIASGTVMSQSPSGGSTVNLNSVVRLVISNGPAPIYAPYLTGKTKDQAQSMLEDAGLELGSVSTDYDEKIDPGLVVEQKPEAGSEMMPGGIVAIVINTPPEVTPEKTLPVSDVTNETVEEAVSRLSIEGFEQCVVWEELGDDELPAGSVRRQEPIPNSDMNPDKPVELYAIERKDKETGYNVKVEFQAAAGDQYLIALEENGIYYVIDHGTVARDGMSTYEPLEVYTVDEVAGIIKVFVNDELITDFIYNVTKQ